MKPALQIVDDDPVYTHDPVCPYCGTDHRGGSDVEGTTTLHCADCGHVFRVTRHVEITYSTERIARLAR